MSPKSLGLETAKITVRLFRSDLDALRAAYPTVGYNQIVRRLVQEHVKALKESTGDLFEEDPEQSEELPDELEFL